MIPALAGLAVVTVAGAVAATGLRDARARLLGLTLALTLAPFLADPFPAPVALGVRVVTALLVVFVVRATVLDSSRSDRRVETRASGAPSLVGWPSDALLAAAAAVLGLALTQALVGAGGDATATSTGSGISTAILGAVGFALLALGASPALLGGRSGSVTVGLLLLTQGTGLVRLAVADTPSDLELVAFAGLLVAIAAGGSTLGAAERREAAAVAAGGVKDAVTALDAGVAADGGEPGTALAPRVAALEALAGFGRVDRAAGWRRRR